MTLAGTAPQSTRSRVSVANSSWAIIDRVPPIEARRVSTGLMAATPTQQTVAGNQQPRSVSNKSFEGENVV